MDVIKKYLQDYEVRGDEGDYIPTEDEKELIYDAIMGLLSDEDFNKEYRSECEKLRSELEIEIMRLAGCGVAALMNTKEGIKDRIGKDNPYWSAS